MNRIIYLLVLLIHKRKVKLLSPKNQIGHLKIGDKVELYGGYDRELEYLQNPSADTRKGKVIDFTFRGHKNNSMAVIKLDYEIICKGFSSDIVIISQRYMNQTWNYKDINVVGVTLVEKNYLKKNFKSIYIESHSSWRIIKE
jgi:hypothetical protein